MKSLSSLDVMANELSLIPNSISSLKNLKKLNLAFNPRIDFKISIPILNKMTSLKLLDISRNYIDPLYLKGLRSKLKEVLISKTKQYQDEFSKIRNELIEGTNVTNSENLNAFIPKN